MKNLKIIKSFLLIFSLVCFSLFFITTIDIQKSNASTTRNNTIVFNGAVGGSSAISSTSPIKMGDFNTGEKIILSFNILSSNTNYMGIMFSLDESVGTRSTTNCINLSTHSTGVMLDLSGLSNYKNGDKSFYYADTIMPAGTIWLNSCGTDTTIVNHHKNNFGWPYTTFWFEVDLNTGDLKTYYGIELPNYCEVYKGLYFENALSINSQTYYYPTLWVGQGTDANSLFEIDSIKVFKGTVNNKTSTAVMPYTKTLEYVSTGFSDVGDICYSFPFTSQTILCGNIHNVKIYGSVPNISLEFTSIRTDEKVGLRFVSSIETDLFSNLLAEYGDNIEVGHLLVKKERLISTDGLTIEKTDINSPYYNTALKVKAQKFYNENYSFSTVLTDIPETEYYSDVYFTPYIKIVDGGEEFIYYGKSEFCNYSSIANYSYNDRQTEKTGEYIFLTNDGDYSKFTLDQLEILNKICSVKNVDTVWDFNKLSSETDVFEVLGEYDNCGKVMITCDPYTNDYGVVVTPKLFAYIGYPAGYGAKLNMPEGGYPAIVLVHGAGGKANTEWCHYWTNKGYVALSVDIGGHMGLETDSSGNLVVNEYFGIGDGLVNGSYGNFGQPTSKIYRVRSWVYQVVSGIIHGNNFLRLQENVNIDKIGMTGISWGGFITNMVSSIDNRFACFAPIYGCGHIYTDSWVLLPVSEPHGAHGLGERFTQEQLLDWANTYDPYSYIDMSTKPMLYISGMDDVAFSPYSRKLTTTKRSGKNYFSYRKNMEHWEYTTSRANTIANQDVVYNFMQHIMFNSSLLVEFTDVTYVAEQNLFNFTINTENVSSVANLYYSFGTDVNGLASNNTHAWTWQKYSFNLINGKNTIEIPNGAVACFVEAYDSTNVNSNDVEPVPGYGVEYNSQLPNVRMSTDIYFIKNIEGIH